MTLDDFRTSLSQKTPPAGISSLLHALWFEAKGDWAGAHKIAQEVDTAEGAWVHAYLHRKEGDLSNSEYWYQKAGRKLPTYSLDEEWTELFNHIGT